VAKSNAPSPFARIIWFSILAHFAEPIARPDCCKTAAAIASATQGLDLAQAGLTILIENTAGSEFSLGGSFEQVAEVIDRLRGIIPIAACIDTCHTHVAGYDIVSEEGIYQTLQDLDATIGLNNVKVIHCNDAKAARGSKLDRHQHIGREPSALSRSAFFSTISA